MLAHLQEYLLPYLAAGLALAILGGLWWVGSGENEGKEKHRNRKG